MFLRQYSQSSQRSILPSLLVSTCLKKSSKPFCTIFLLKNRWSLSSSLTQVLSSFLSRTLLLSLSCLRKISSTNFLQQESINKIQIIKNRCIIAKHKSPSSHTTSKNQNQCVNELIESICLCKPRDINVRTCSSPSETIRVALTIQRITGRGVCMCFYWLSPSQNNNIMSRASEHCPARLKATLTNFRSYCQKTGSPLVSISAQVGLNTAITKYRSYREMKLMTHKSEFGHFASSKNQNTCSPTKKEDSNLIFKQSELIDLIKHKLREKNSFNGRVKTDLNDKEDTLQRKLQKKQAEVMTHYANTTKMVKGIKRKKIDLTVTNSKIGLYVKEERQQLKSKEIVIAIKERPCSAIQYRTVYSPHKDYQSKMPSKHSAHFIRQEGQPSKQAGQNNEIQRAREISGWEFQQQQQAFLQPEVQPVKKKSKRKRRLESKSKQK